MALMRPSSCWERGNRHLAVLSCPLERCPWASCSHGKHTRADIVKGEATASGRGFRAQAGARVTAVFGNEDVTGRREMDRSAATDRAATESNSTGLPDVVMLGEHRQFPSQDARYSWRKRRQ